MLGGWKCWLVVVLLPCFVQLLAVIFGLFNIDERKLVYD